MPRSSNQKLKLVFLKDIFTKLSDEDHPITMAQIIAELARNGIAAERKSLYDDMALLNDYGFEILTDKHKTTGYYLGGRDFDIAELKLLIDSVQASKFITLDKTKDLIKKLEGLCSRHQASQLQHQVVTLNRIKTMNKSIYYNVDTIHQAIIANKQITFQYFKYDFHKEKRYFSDGEPYTESPFALLYNQENYYLLVFNEETQKFKNFRVDRMEHIELTEVDRLGNEEYEKIDLAEYTKSTFSMFSGPNEMVTMQFPNHLAGAVIDQFGLNIHMSAVNKMHFRVTVSVNISEQFLGWVFALGKKAKILAPEWVREKMTDLLADVASFYSKTQKD